MRLHRACLAVGIVSVSLLAAPATAPPPFWPGVKYDPAIPSLKQVIGHENGARITSHEDIVRYIEALAKAQPGRMRVFDYGRTWEGKRLIYAVIGTPKNISRLDAIRSAMDRLSDPRKTPEPDARRLMNDLPALVWLGYGVHGNEISSSDAALMTAYHLLAARGDALTDKILSETLVFLDPAQNPDGRDRFVHAFEQTVGLEPDAFPLAAEHNEQWPGGRSNHYHFDMNRDWISMTQPETKGRIKALLEWHPLVFIDLHEMGSDGTYYFTPEAAPYNPHLAKPQVEALDWFGRNNAKWFDQFGFPYFTREVYDAFYPGYGASWPLFYGAVAATYEQASARGLVMRKSDDTVFTYRDTVRQHFVASLATCETAAINRQKLLSNYYDYRRSAIEEPQTVKEYVLVRSRDTSSADKLAVLLADQGIEVRRAKAAFRAEEREVPAGSYLISSAQPSRRLIQTLLNTDVKMPESFVKEAEHHRLRKESTEIYDVTGWSLPLLYNVEMLTSTAPVTVDAEPVKPGHSFESNITGTKAAVAWLVPWGTNASARFLTAALRRNLKVLSADKSFVQNGRTFPRGTLIVGAKANENLNLEATVRELAKTTGAEAVATDTGWMDEGVNFGSRHVFSLRPPAIALAWDRPSSASSAGHTRFVLERQFGYPVSVIRTASLAAADLSKFQVIILPDGIAAGDGGYSGVLNSAATQHIKAWVSGGGTLIGLGGAMSWMADPRVGLLAVSQENLATETTPATPRPAGTGAATPAAPAAPTTGTSTPAATPAPDGRVAGKIFTSEEDYAKAIRPTTELPDSAPGAVVRVNVDAEHWLTAGAPASVYTILNGRNIFTPIRLDKGVNAAVFASAKDLLGAGYIWEENRKQLAFKPLLVLQPEGRGNVIGFAVDPNYRAMQDGMNILFLNAVFRGPAHNRPVGGFGAEEQ